MAMVDMAAMKTQGWVLVVSLLLRAASAEAGPRLDQVCPVDWRAVPLIEAVRALAEQLDVPYILDATVDEEALARPVRLSAQHLDGRQAFRWTVRAAGLDAVLVDGAMMIARPDRLPGSWRAVGVVTGAAPSDPGSGPASATQAAGTGDARWAEAWRRQADLAWADAPLSRLVRDVSDRFGVDLVFHAQILEDQPLVRFEGRQVDLAAVIRGLEERLDAVGRYEDGVLWVRPVSSATTPPVTATISPSPSPLAPGSEVSVLSRPVRLTAEPATPVDLGQVFQRATGLQCRVGPPAQAQVPFLSAQGTLLEVLEAGRMLAGWNWKISPSDEPEKLILLIRTEGSGRSVP